MALVITFYARHLYYLLLMIYIFQEQFIFLDDDLPQDYVYQFDSTFEEVNLSSGKAELNGIYFPVDSAQGVII